MELLSREQRDGEPLACAYGCQPMADNTVRAGLLFVRAGIDDLLTFEDPATGTTYALHLPDDYLNLSHDSWGVSETMELEP